MNYQEIENKLVDFAHKKEGKDYPIHEVDVGTAVDFAIEQVKNLSTPDVVERSELLFAFIKAVKEEFADQNWDYLDFIADRVISKHSC